MSTARPPPRIGPREKDRSRARKQALIYLQSLLGSRTPPRQQFLRVVVILVARLGRRKGPPPPPPPGSQ